MMCSLPSDNPKPMDTRSRSPRKQRIVPTKVPTTRLQQGVVNQLIFLAEITATDSHMSFMVYHPVLWLLKGVLRVTWKLATTSDSVGDLLNTPIMLYLIRVLFIVLKPRLRLYACTYYLYYYYLHCINENGLLLALHETLPFCINSLDSISQITTSLIAEQNLVSGAAEWCQTRRVGF